jgi:hypothetical protein
MSIKSYKYFHVTKHEIWKKIYFRYKSNFLYLIIKDNKTIFYVLHDTVYYDISIDDKFLSIDSSNCKIFYTGLLLNLNHSLIGIRNDCSCKYIRECSLYGMFNYIENLIFKSKLNCSICESHKNICKQHVISNINNK